MKDIADMNVKSRSEVTSVDEFQYIVLPNGKKRYYREPDMPRTDRKTANIIYNPCAGKAHSVRGGSASKCIRKS